MHVAAAETIVKHVRVLLLLFRRIRKVPSLKHLVLLVAQCDLLGARCDKKLDVAVLALSIC